MWSFLRQKGNKAEDLVCRFLMKQGFLIKDRNYLQKCGEIDIVAVKDKVIYFFEVKSGFGRPEERINDLKLKRQKRVIEIYMEEKRLKDREVSFGVAIVRYSHKDNPVIDMWVEESFPI